MQNSVSAKSVPTIKLAWLLPAILLYVLPLYLLSAAPVYAAPPYEWYTHRFNGWRTGAQPSSSDLSNPTKVTTLAVQRSFPPDGQPAAGAFTASPIVVKDTVFIGSLDGIFYALDAATLAVKWRYPKATDPHPQLRGTCNQGGNGTYGQYGIRSSASYAKIGGKDAVIFGAPDPDPSVDAGRGSGALFALDFSGNLIWKSPPVAHVTGCNYGSSNEQHQRIGYSSPLVFANKVYVGIHDADDSPIQQGQLGVVELANGNLVPFPYASTGTLGDGSRGGGIWNSPATDWAGVFFTTGNTRNPGCFYPYTACPPATEPSPNHGLSMIRVDKDTGHVGWAFQPVPFNRDGDPDWAAGAAVMAASCGRLIASVQKDGWSYALNASDGKLRWQFPPTGFGSDFLNAMHGDDDYKRPGAVWKDVLIIGTGGWALSPVEVGAGYGKLHALDACASDAGRVRWIADIPNSSGDGYSVGVPTVTGGIIFVGTDQGFLIVLADPSIVPAAGKRCSNTNPMFNPPNCVAPYSMIDVPSVLTKVAMPDHGDIAGLRREAALAKGRVFVATGNGHVYMLAVVPPPPDECKVCKGHPVMDPRCCQCSGGIWRIEPPGGGICLRPIHRQ
jgi:outer membrane protein assembly factor BamB